MNRYELHDVFEYRYGKIFWRLSPRYGVEIGDEAGSKESHGYREIQYKGVRYKTHRLVYFLHTGKWPPIIDHIDQNKGNNKIENLRDVPQLINCHNCSVSWGETPFRGVSFVTGKKKYRAQFNIKGKKTFLGYFKTPEEASKVYEEYKNNKIQEALKLVPKPREELT